MEFKAAFQKTLQLLFKFYYLFERLVQWETAYLPGWMDGWRLMLLTLGIFVLVVSVVSLQLNCPQCRLRSSG
jgi:hypothetical protein